MRLVLEREDNFVMVELWVIGLRDVVEVEMYKEMGEGASRHPSIAQLHQFSLHLQYIATTSLLSLPPPVNLINNEVPDRNHFARWPSLCSTSRVRINLPVDSLRYEN